MPPPLLTTPLRFGTRCFRCPLPNHLLTSRYFSTRAAISWPQSFTPPHNPLDPIAAHRLEVETRAHYTRRTYYAATGAVVCMLSILVLVSTYELPIQPEKSDAPSRWRSSSDLETAPALAGDASGGAEIRKVRGGGTVAGAQGLASEVEQVATGTSSVPFFPKSISLPMRALSTSVALPSGNGDANEAYQLVGLGIRTVSFLGIQVYVVGLYIATSDVATLQARLVRKAAGTETASTLVVGEKEDLKKILLDAEGSERVWGEVLKDGGIRSAIRIVPTRNTDLAHLRDGWVRGITARSRDRSRGQGGTEGYEDEEFGAAVAAFKGMFGGAGKKGLGKGKVLMLERNAGGVLAAWLETENDDRYIKMGEVQDERISRLVWLGYLAGKNVASESARKSMVEGVMEFVERPIGTVETQVV